MSVTHKSSLFINYLSLSLKTVNVTLKSVIITIEVFSMSVLGKRLKQARSDSGLKQIDAAKKLGISNGTLSGYERNYRDPDTDTLNEMANLYEVSVDWLLGKVNQSSVDNDNEEIDEELQDFIDNVKVWYKEEPETKEERLRMMKKMFEVFKEDE